MKNIFKTSVSCLALAIAVTSCYDDLEDKSSIDAKYEQASNITTTLGETNVLTFSQIAAEGSVSDTLGVLETGVMVSTTEDFASYSVYKAAEVATSFQVTVNNLEEKTTYYVRSYAYTTNGTMVSEPTSVTTPVAPIFDLNGTYTAIDFDPEDDSEAGEYEVTIQFAEGSETDILITNLWDGGLTVEAKFDPKTGKISIPAGQVIYVHADYGDVWMEDEDGNDNIAGQFIAKGGFLNINTYSAVCGAGSFGSQYVKMNHK